MLGAYREGNAGQIIRASARAALAAATESAVSAARLAVLPAQWMQSYADGFGRVPRAGSAARRILELLMHMPFFTPEQLKDRIGGSTSSVYSAIDKLAEVDILRRLTERKRDQIWCAGAIIDELEELGSRIARQTTANSVWRNIRRSLLFRESLTDAQSTKASGKSSDGSTSGE